MKKGIKISNREFLEAIAGDRWRDVLVQSYAVGEANKPGAFRSERAGVAVGRLVTQDANYFCVSLMKRTATGRISRTKDCFVEQFAFVLDDLGTKLIETEARKILPPPTYVLETSPGNFQWGYKITGGTDACVMDALVDSVVHDQDVNPSLKDPGMVGINRVMRLPVGSNVKPEVMAANGGKPCAHVLHVWQPSRCYSVEELAGPLYLGADISPPALERGKGIGGTRNATQSEEHDDYILRILDEKGMILNPHQNDGGWIEIVCPWAEEHSDGREGAGYRPGLGGFQCHHGHCEGRGMVDLKAWVATECAHEQAAALAEVFDDGFDFDDPALLVEVERVKARHKEKIVLEKAQFDMALDSTIKDDDEDDEGAPRDNECEESPRLSEDWLALSFVDRFGHMLRYVPTWGKWKVFDGACWRDDDKLLTFDAARKVCRAGANIAETQTDKKRLASAKTRASVVNLAQSDPRIVATIGQWDANLMLLNTPGGVVDLRTGEIRAQRPDDYLSKITSVTPGGGCPTFLNFILRITGGDREYVAYLRRVFGYCLTGLTTEDALFFLHGSGANGKSTLLRVIKAILDDYAISSPSSVFTAQKFESHPTEIARLHNKRLVVSSEIEPGQKWAESRIKQLTGGDDVSARLMRQDYFDFTPQLKLVIAGNHKPSMSDVSEAFHRRFHLLPFTVTIPREERDTDLEAKLLSEGAGILAWMIEGCAEWQKIGLQPPAVVTKATGEYLDSQDRVALWIEADCEEKPNAKELLISTARKAYNEWAFRNAAERLNRDQFSERMAHLGYHKVSVSAGFVLPNILLKPKPF